MTDVVLQADAVIVGGGPSGLAGAALFGRFGWAVELFERHLSPCPLRRASLSDHEMIRIFRSVGAAAAYVRSSAEGVPGYDWFNGQGRALMSIPWLAQDVSGSPTASIASNPASRMNHSTQSTVCRMWPCTAIRWC